MTNVLITGLPRVGKTTLIQNLIKQLAINCAGFYTEEIRDANRQRIGFKVVGLTNKQEGKLAHIEIKSNYRVGKYFVDLKGFEKIVLPEMDKKADLIVIDEIGKMELFSRQFKEQLLLNLDKGNVLATITKKGGGEFVGKIKNREDCQIYELTVENRNLLTEEILRILKEKYC